MSFGLSAIASICMFVLPGFVYLAAEASQKESPPTFSINRELFVAILVSVISHVVLITVIEVSPFFPNVDFPEAYRALSGAGGYVPGPQLVKSIPWFAMYLVALYGGSAICGRLATRGIPGVPPLELLRAPTGPERYLSAGEQGIWCIVDIVTASEKLYRGIYHSTSPKGGHCPSASINLVLASRWSGQVKQTPNKESAEDSGVSNRPQPGFRDVKAWVSIEELRDMIRLATAKIDDAHTQRTIELILKHEGSMEDLLINHMMDIPEFYVFWHDIKNINVRRFELDSDDLPTDEEIAIQFPESLEPDKAPASRESATPAWERLNQGDLNS